MTDEKSKEATVLCRVERAFWDAGGVRVNEGVEVDLPVNLALDFVETGVVTRVKAPK